MHLCAAQVPSYAVAQVLGSTLASLTLRVVFGGATAREHFFGTAPSGSDAQAVALAELPDGLRSWMHAGREGEER